ncbi:MAG: hypothetical protein ACK5H1_02810 [Tenacibaculum sp.]
MKFLIIVFFALGVSQCASQKFEKKPPFSISSANYSKTDLQNNKHIDLYLSFSSVKKVDFKQLYFLNKVCKAEVKIKNGVNYITGRFSTLSKPDIILHADPKKEIKNKLLQYTVPFKLKENEAVLSYKEKNSIKFFKIKNIVQK